MDREEFDGLRFLILEYQAKRRVAKLFIRDLKLSPDALPKLLDTNTPTEMEDLARSLATPLDANAAIAEAEAILKGA